MSGSLDPLMSGSLDPLDPSADFVSAIRDKGERSGPDAVSPKGATGVMQVMPDTAASPGFGIAPADPSNPADVERVGQQYARAMLARYGGNQILASAAYNAGPGQVDKWIRQFGDPRTGETTNALWQSQIPFAETRNYTQRVAGGPGALGQTGAAPQAPQQSNPLAVAQAPAQQTMIQAEPSGLQALQLMQLLLPTNHHFVPVDYDPWKVAAAGQPTRNSST